MNIEHRITTEDSVALTKALAASGESHATFLVCGTVSLAALTLAMPFSASNEGGIRLSVALVLALAASWVAKYLIDWLRAKRTRWFPIPSVTGLEPGVRRVSLALESVREVSELGERVFRWRVFQGVAETPEWIALQVSDRECLVLPRAALNNRGLAEAETLAALIGRGGR